MWDDGRLADGRIGFLERSSFLNKSSLEKVWQIGVDAHVDLRYGLLRVAATAGYTLEVLENRDLDPAAPRETNHMFSLGVSVGL